MSIKVYLMAILDNYMFRPLLAIFRLSSREFKVLLYILCVHKQTKTRKEYVLRIINNRNSIICLLDCASL